MFRLDRRKGASRIIGIDLPLKSTRNTERRSSCEVRKRESASHSIYGSTSESAAYVAEQNMVAFPQGISGSRSKSSCWPLAISSGW
jgi:hypothetical protein